MVERIDFGRLPKREGITVLSVAVGDLWRSQTTRILIGQTTSAFVDILGNKEDHRGLAEKRTGQRA